jgi:hypothetical protein
LGSDEGKNSPSSLPNAEFCDGKKTVAIDTNENDPKSLSAHLRAFALCWPDRRFGFSFLFPMLAMGLNIP